MLRGFISESRQGEENTTALLDTLQQAMIRLLDRVDAMEFNAMQSAHAQAQSAPQEYVREQVRFGVDPVARLSHSHTHSESEPAAALDAAVAAVASAKTMASPFAQAPGSAEFGGPMGNRPDDHHPVTLAATAPRSPEKLRQDFIAEARRAKMRLAAESEADEDGVTINRPGMDATDELAKPAPQAGSRHRQAASKGTCEGIGGVCLSTPRLKVLALGGIVALAGAWYVLKFGPVADQAGRGRDVSSRGTCRRCAVAADVAKTGAPRAAGEAAEPASGHADGGTRAYEYSARYARRNRN